MLVFVCVYIPISHHNFIKCGPIVTKLYMEIARYYHNIFLTSWHIFLYHDKNSMYWRHDALFYIMTNFLTSWQTFWCYDELFDMKFLTFDQLFDVMTNFLMPWFIFYIMTNFLTSWHICNVMTNFWRHDEHLTSKCIFDIMTNFLASWQTFWCHDALFDIMTHFLTSWRTFELNLLLMYFLRIFYVMTYFWCHGIFGRHDEIFDIMTYY